MIVSSITGFINQYVIPAINTVGGAITGFINAILKFPEWFPKWFMDNIASPISKSISAIGTAIWNALPDWLKNALTAISNFFTQSVVTFFSQTLPSFFDWFAKGLQAFFKDPLGWIKTNLIDPLYNSVVKPILDFFTKTIPEFFTKTLPDWFMNQFVPTVMGGLKAIWDFLTAVADFIWKGMQFTASLIWKGLEALWSAILSGLEWLGKTILKFAATLAHWVLTATFEFFKVVTKTIIDAVQGFYKWIFDTAFAVAKGIGDFLALAIKETLKPMLTAIASEFGKPFHELVEKLAKGEKIQGELEELLELAGLYSLAIVGSQYLSLGIWALLHLIERCGYSVQ
jgi:hypothetical protein